MAIALTVYPNDLAASTTLSTAYVLVGNATINASGAGHGSTVGTALGFGECFSQGTGAAWAAGAVNTSIAPTGHGWFLDATTLDGKDIVAGNWTAAWSANVTANTATIDLYTRIFTYLSGTYTLIGYMLQSGAAFTSALTTYTSPATALPSIHFSTGMKLYIDLWANVTASTMIAGSVINVRQSNLAGDGLSACNTITPGYVTTSTRTIPATAALLATPTRTVPSSAALTGALTRTATASAALLGSSTRTMGATVALLATPTRTVAASAALSVARSLPANVALLATLTRTTPATVALSGAVATLTRTIPSSGALALVSYIPRALSALLVQIDFTLRTVPASAALLGALTRTVAASGALSSLILASDTFVRANQANWGQASGTGTWAKFNGTSTASISGNKGLLTGATNVTTEYLGGTSAADVDVKVRFIQSATTAACGLIARGVPASSNYYAAQLKNGSLTINSVAAGTFTAFATTAFSAVAGSAYWLRYRLVGSQHQAKVWADGSAEPTAWQLTATNSTYSAAGQFGLVAQQALVGDTVQFDSFIVWLAGWSTALPAPIYYGAYQPPAYTSTAGIATFETLTGTTMSIVQGYCQWGAGTTTFNTTWANAIRAHGSIPLLTWEPWDLVGPTNATYTLANITAGNFDTYITTFANAIKAWGHPLFLRLAHEMNGVAWYPWQEGSNGNAVGQYVPMWKHVHDIFTAQGVPNVTWVWCPNDEGGGSYPITGLYPGDAYVDWLGIDGYNASGGQTFGQIYTPIYNDLVALSTKPIMIAEFGASEEAAGIKGNWYYDMLQVQLPYFFPKIRAVVAFNSAYGTHTTIPVNSTADALSQFVAGATSGYYVGNTQGSIATTPIPPYATTMAARSMGASAALLTQSARSMGASAALLATSTRSAAVSTALLTQSARSMGASVALLTQSARSMGASTALLASLISRTVGASAALLAPFTRSVPVSSALLLTKIRTVGASAALQATTTRAVPVSSALIATSIRTAPATGAMLATSTRTVGVAAAVQGQASRSIPTSAALLRTQTRILPTVGALALTQTRTMPASTALTLVQTQRQVGASATLLATSARTLPLTCALTGQASRSIPVTGALSITRVVPSNVALLLASSRVVPATAALLGTSARALASSAALLATRSRTMTANTALSWIMTRSMPASATLTLFNASRTLPTTGALLRQANRSIGASTPLLATVSRQITASAALVSQASRSIPVQAPLLATRTRGSGATVALIATLSRTIGTSVALSLPGVKFRDIPCSATLSGGSRIIPATGALRGTQTRGIPCTVSISLPIQGVQIGIPASAALQSTSARFVLCAVALLASNASLRFHSGVADVRMRSGIADVRMRSGVADILVS